MGGGSNAPNCPQTHRGWQAGVLWGGTEVNGPEIESVELSKVRYYSGDSTCAYRTRSIEESKLVSPVKRSQRVEEHEELQRKLEKKRSHNDPDLLQEASC